MKIALAVFCVAAMIACKADLPPLTDAKGSLDARCTTFADLLVDTFPTSLANASASLGAPDATAVSLTKDNVVTVGFVGLGGVTDASGIDLRLHAMVEPGASALVHVAASEMMFAYAGTLTPTANEMDIAVASLTSALYVRVIDVSGTIQLDAVEATHDTCN